jgi:hypothetical protein
LSTARSALAPIGNRAVDDIDDDMMLDDFGWQQLDDESKAAMALLELPDVRLPGGDEPVARCGRSTPPPLHSPSSSQLSLPHSPLFLTALSSSQLSQRTALPSSSH